MAFRSSLPSAPEQIGFVTGSGIYANWYSDFGLNAFPGIDLGYNLTDKIRVYANAGKSYRIPTFYDQYYSSPAEQGNPDLAPEEAQTYEIAVCDTISAQ